MDSILLNRLIVTLLILFVAVPALFALVSYVWNKKYVPYQADRGKTVRSFGRWMSEINQYVFKEDKKTLAPKAPKLVQKILSLRAIHLLLVGVGIVGTIITGQWWMLSTLPISFMLGVGRAVPRIKERQKTLDRIFDIASSSIRFGSKRGRNAPAPASWKFITASEWNEKGIPGKIVMTFPAGAGPEIAGQKTFQKTFEQMVTEENIWVYDWDLPTDKVTITAVAKLPTQLPYPGSQNQKWSVFPVGQSARGEASYDVSVFPHVLVAGPSGTGKSVLQRNIVFHCIQHNNDWRFLGIDLKRVELTPYNVYKKTVMGIATDVEQGLEVLKFANNEMMDRYKMMEEAKVPNIMDMDSPPPRILVMIDEATMFLGQSGSKTEEGKAEDAMKAEAADLVGKILRLGRASGVHMLIAMQRPDATVLRGEYKANMDVRLAAGRMDSTPSSMVLDSGEAVNLPGIKGRGLIRVGGGLEEFQGYFAPQNWIDDLILKNPSLEPSCVAPGGHLHEKYKALQKIEEKQASDSSEEITLTKEEAPADPSPTLKKEDNTLPVEVEEPSTNNAQTLADALTKKPEQSQNQQNHTKPSFFTKEEEDTNSEATEPVVDLNVTPDIEPELAGNDSLMDDYSDLDEVLNKQEGFTDTPVSPTPQKPAQKAPAVQWNAVSPFGSNTAPQTPQKPVSEGNETLPEIKKPTQKLPTRPTRPTFPGR